MTGSIALSRRSFSRGTRIGNANRHSGGIPAASSIALLLVAGPLLVACQVFTGTVELFDFRKDQVELGVYYITDWKAQVSPVYVPEWQASYGGIEYVAGTLARRRGSIEERQLRSMLFFVGDTLFGSEESTISSGRSSIEILNHLSVTAMLPGTLDFNLGHRLVRERFEELDFPVVISNVEDSDLPFTPFLNGETLDTKYWVFGLLPENLRSRLHPKTPEFRIAPPIEALDAYLEDTEKSDVVIVLSDCGLEIDEEIASRPKVDLVIGTRRSVDPHETIAVGNAAVVNARSNGIVIGASAFTRRGNRQRLDYAASTEIPVEPSSSSRSEELARIAASYSPAPELEERLAVSLIDLTGDSEIVRKMDAPLGHLIADAMLHHSESDVAMINSGTIRAGVLSGAITIADIYRIMPFPNRVFVLDVPGARLASMVDHSLRLQKDSRPNGGFLQLSGIIVETDGSRIASLTIGDRPLQRDRYYRLALTDFLYFGGDSYEPLTDYRYHELGELRDIVIAHFRDLEWIEPSNSYSQAYIESSEK